LTHADLTKAYRKFSTSPQQVGIGELMIEFSILFRAVIANNSLLRRHCHSPYHPAAEFQKIETKSDGGEGEVFLV
jgi:hypothetical protein